MEAANRNFCRLCHYNDSNDKHLFRSHFQEGVSRYVVEFVP